MSLAPLPASLGVRDVRHLMVRRPWSIGRRPGKPDSVTWHWNGPEPVDRSSYASELRQLVGDSKWHTRPGAFDVPRGGDGIMYHLAVTSQGIIVALRDIEDELWHAGNGTANLWSISIHFPLGGDQLLTPIQWQRGIELSMALVDIYKMPAGRFAIRGHHEWPRSGGGAQSACPGTAILRSIADWRSEISKAPRIFEVKKDIDFAMVRQASSLKGREAGRLEPGQRFEVSEIVGDDSNKNGPKVWLHHKSEWGFTHISTATEVTL